MAEELEYLSMLEALMDPNADPVEHAVLPDVLPEVLPLPDPVPSPNFLFLIAIGHPEALKNKLLCLGNIHQRVCVSPPVR